MWADTIPAARSGRVADLVRGWSIARVLEVRGAILQTGPGQSSGDCSYWRATHLEWKLSSRSDHAERASCGAAERARSPAFHTCGACLGEEPQRSAKWLLQENRGNDVVGNDVVGNDVVRNARALNALAVRRWSYQHLPGRDGCRESGSRREFALGRRALHGLGKCERASKGQ